MSDAEARLQGHDEYDVIEEQFNRELDGSLGHRGESPAAQRIS